MTDTEIKTETAHVSCPTSIELNPALTDFRGLTIFFYYMRTSVKKITKKITENNLKEQ